jgi:hypothetical protein
MDNTTGAELPREALILNTIKYIIMFKRESPFWFKNGTDHTPIPLFADSVSLFQYKMSLKEERDSNTR